MIREWLRHAYYRYWVLPPLHRVNKQRSTVETFQEIYRNQRWGSDGSRFFSGAGSHGPASDQYCAAVVNFIRDRNVQSVIDLGCGDFSVGRRIVEATGVRYTGIDVVPELIEHHRNTIQDPRVSFQNADITTDTLPPADLCLIRQVLQHLSNSEIAKVLAKLDQFPLALISEEVPNCPVSFNLDKPHGGDVRAYCGSGVYLERPPFSRQARELWSFPLDPRSQLRTVLFEQPSSAGLRSAASALSKK